MHWFSYPELLYLWVGVRGGWGGGVVVERELERTVSYSAHTGLVNEY